MSSVRVTAAGAVIVASLCFFTAPVSACDDRFVKKCEKASAAAAAAAEMQSEPVARRKSATRVRVISSRRSKYTRLVKRSRAPGFTVKRERGMTLASESSPVTTLLPESALARRFRGFIDPQPMAQNAFEALRKPHLVALNLEPAVTLPPVEAVAEAPPAAAAATVAPMAKQDKISVKPAALAETAPAKPVALAEALATKPVATVEATVALPASPPVAQATAQAFLSAAPPTAPADERPSPFSIHQLVLALCGALGAASALRFIVGA